MQGVVISVDKKRGAVGLKASPGLVANNMVPFVLCSYCALLVSDISKMICIYVSRFCKKFLLFVIHSCR